MGPKDSKRYQDATDELRLRCTGHSRRGEQREQLVPKAANVPTGIEITCLLGNALVCFRWILESGVSNQIKGKHVSFVLCSRLCKVNHSRVLWDLRSGSLGEWIAGQWKSDWREDGL